MCCAKNAKLNVRQMNEMSDSRERTAMNGMHEMKMWNLVCENSIRKTKCKKMLVICDMTCKNGERDVNATNTLHRKRARHDIVHDIMT